MDNVQQLVSYQFRTQQAPEWLPLLPKPGEYYHEWYGDLDLTAERIERLVASFNNKVYQSTLPIDAEHYMGDPEGAMGWIEALRINSDGSVDAKVEWTDRGLEALANDRFRYVSPSYMEEWFDNEGNRHRDVLVGAALTTRPWFKEDALRSIVAASDGIWLYERDPAIGLTKQLQFSERKPRVKKLHEYSAAEIQTLDRDDLWAMVVRHDYNDLTDEQSAAVLAALTVTKTQDTSDLQTQLSEAQAQVAALQQQLDAAKQTPDPDPSVEKQMSEMRVSIQAANDQIKTLSDQLKTQTERGDRLQRENDRKRFSDMAKDWVGDTAKHVDHLEAMAKAFGEDNDTFKFYVSAQNQAAESAIALTEVVGKDILLDETTPEGKLDQLAKNYAAEHKLDYHTAYTQVLETPEGIKLLNQSLA